MNTRKAEVLVNGYWEEAEFGKLEECDAFRLFEEDGAQVDHGQICVALGNAHLVEDDVWGIKCQPAGQHRLPSKPKEGMVAFVDNEPLKFMNGEWVGAKLTKRSMP